MHLTPWISEMHKPVLNLPEKGSKLVKRYPLFWGFITKLADEDDKMTSRHAWSLQVASICRWWDLRSLFLLFTGRKVRTVLTDLTVLLYFGPQDSSSWFCCVFVNFHYLTILCESSLFVRNLCSVHAQRAGHFTLLHTLAMTDTYLKWNFAISHPFTNVNEQFTVLRSSETGRGRARHSHQLDLDLEKHSGCRGKIHSWHILAPFRQ